MFLNLQVVDIVIIFNITIKLMNEHVTSKALSF